MSKKYDFTINSTDPLHNNRILVNLSSAETEYCKLTVTNLTTSANMVLLKSGDFILFEERSETEVVTFTFTYEGDDLGNLGDGLFVTEMNSYIETQSLLKEKGLTFNEDSCGRIYITANNDFSILNCSYNFKLLLGIYNTSLPLISENRKLHFPNVGCYLSTPVLYLASNIGSNFYKNFDKSFTSLRILMRINNSFFVKQPIIAGNGDFTTTIKSSDLSDVRFDLIDANFHEVELLSPMYLTIEIETIPDVNANEHDFSNGAIDISSVLNVSKYGNFHDIIERGKDYNNDELNNVFVIHQK